MASNLPSVNPYHLLNPMRPIISFITLMLFAACLFQGFRQLKQDERWNDCFTKYRSNWGEACSSCPSKTDTYKVYLRNNCSVTVDAVVCVQENTKRWKYYSYKKVGPNDSVSAYACVGTGKFLRYVKPSDNTEIILPTADQVNEQYAK